VALAAVVTILMLGHEDTGTAGLGRALTTKTLDLAAVIEIKRKEEKGRGKKKNRVEIRRNMDFRERERERERNEQKTILPRPIANRLGIIKK